MLEELLTITDHGRGTNHGLERVPFTSPVRVGSEIRLVASIKDGRRRDDGGVQCRVALVIQVRGQDRPAMVAESIYITYPAEPAETAAPPRPL
ncbi:MAG: hypothetical protein IRZ08_16075 [Frankia sp.]|nr:hypothetical protein [Frankia sp.]